MKASYLAFLLLLSACTPKAIMTPVDVDIPVPVSCHVEMPPAPSWLVPAAANADAPSQLIAMATDLDHAHGYIAELEAAIGACQ